MNNMKVFVAVTAGLEFDNSLVLKDAILWQLKTLQFLFEDLLAKGEDEVTINTDSTQISAIIHNKAIGLYDLKQYKESLYEIFTAMQLYQPFLIDTVKLMIANFQCLGYNDLACTMYSKYFEATGDIEALFYSAVCAYISNQYDKAQALLQNFIEQIKQSAIYQAKYQELTKQALILIKQMHNRNA